MGEEGRKREGWVVHNMEIHYMRENGILKPTERQKGVGEASNRGLNLIKIQYVHV